MTSLTELLPYTYVTSYDITDSFPFMYVTSYGITDSFPFMYVTSYGIADRVFHLCMWRRMASLTEFSIYVCDVVWQSAWAPTFCVSPCGTNVFQLILSGLLRPSLMSFWGGTRTGSTNSSGGKGLKWHVRFNFCQIKATVAKENSAEKKVKECYKNVDKHCCSLPSFRRIQTHKRLEKRQRKNLLVFEIFEILCCTWHIW